jgi:hypothetical protein
VRVPGPPSSPPQPGRPGTDPRGRRRCWPTRSARAARRARDADPAGAARLRAARHVRRCRSRNRPIVGRTRRGPRSSPAGPRRGPRAALPGPGPRPPARRSSTRSSPPPATAIFDALVRRAAPGRRAARRRRCLAHPAHRRPPGVRRTSARPQAVVANPLGPVRAPGALIQLGPSGSGRAGARKVFSVMASRRRDGRIRGRRRASNDPERLATLDLTLPRRADRAWAPLPHVTLPKRRPDRPSRGLGGARTPCWPARWSVAAGARRLVHRRAARRPGADHRRAPAATIQDGAVLHADPGFPLSIGAGVSVGHRAVLHGCTIGDDRWSGWRVVMNGARSAPGRWSPRRGWCWRAPRSRRARWWPACRRRCAGA